MTTKTCPTCGKAAVWDEGSTGLLASSPMYVEGMATGFRESGWVLPCSCAEQEEFSRRAEQARLLREHAARQAAAAAAEAAAGLLPCDAYDERLLAAELPALPGRLEWPGWLGVERRVGRLAATMADYTQAECLVGPDGLHLRVAGHAEVVVPWADGGRPAPRRVIVSRHAAAVELIRAARPEFADAPVLESATPDDVRGAVVAGNLPLHLAALCREVIAVEFDGPPPRGAEYGLADMRAAGARLASYRVEAV